MKERGIWKCERRRKERGADAGLEKKRKEKKMEGKERRKERKNCKGKKERKKERREGGGMSIVSWPVFAGGDRSWPELGGQGPKREGG